MIDNIIPFNRETIIAHNVQTSEPGVLTTAERLRALADRAEKEPENFRYLLAMTASADMSVADWSMAGHPSLLIMLGLMEFTKYEIHTMFTLANPEND